MGPSQASDSFATTVKMQSYNHQMGFSSCLECSKSTTCIDPCDIICDQSYTTPASVIAQY